MSVLHLPNPINSNQTIINTGTGTASVSTANSNWWITTPGILSQPSTTIYPNTTTTWTTNTILDEPLKNLNYIVEFDIDDEEDKELLEINIKSIKKNKMLFNCNYVGNRIQPYELIMKLISKKIKFAVSVEVSDILSIHYIGFQFVEIVNNLNFGTECDFSELNVKFKYDDIKYENYKLSTKELRLDKLKKIMEVENE